MSFSNSGVGRLACLAILGVIVLVACSSGPGVTAPTVKDGAGKVLASTLSLVEEGTKTVALSDVFTGEGLEYSEGSSDETVAEAEIAANGTLTITAHKAGTATITVTATNAGGSVKYEVKVTVQSKPAGVAAPTVTAGATTSVEFAQGETTKTVALSGVFTGESLTYSVGSNNPTVATASTSAGTLTITAHSPGTATITVTATNAGGNVSHGIAVTVPATSAPTVRAGAPASVAFVAGQTARTVSLSSVFTGQNLTFSDPRSSRPAVATASIANGILTITAVSPGAATIELNRFAVNGTATRIFLLSLLSSSLTPWTR